MLPEDEAIVLGVIVELGQVRESLTPIRSGFGIDKTLEPQKELDSAKIILGKAMDKETASTKQSCVQFLQSAIDRIDTVRSTMEWIVGGLGIDCESIQEQKLKVILKKLYKLIHNIRDV